MKKTKRFSQKKVTLSTCLAVLAICGSLSVSAADTMDLTAAGTTHTNKVSSSSKTADTVAIGFDNQTYNGALTIGDHNYAINTDTTLLAEITTAITALSSSAMTIKAQPPLPSSGKETSVPAGPPSSAEMQGAPVLSLWACKPAAVFSTLANQ